MVRRTLIRVLVLALGCGMSFAQTPNLEPNSKTSQLPIVSFDFALPGTTPPHYSIAVEPDGKAAYRADEVPAAGAVADQPYTLKFVLSEPTRARIFELTLALNCFKGNFEFRGGRIANMGAKTLKCAYADHESQTTYNYSTNEKLQELTTIFQNISNTLEYGRRLAFLHRFDKLGLEAEMKSMEEQAHNNRLAELQVAAPQLEAILNDSSVINVTRRRAEHLLQLIKANPAARAAAPQ